MKLSELFDKDLIKISLHVENRIKLFDVMCNELYNKGYVKYSFYDAIIRRELQFPTGLKLNKYNVAIPHADPEYVLKPAVAIATLSEPIDFNNMADSTEVIKVNIVFMLALNEPHGQIEILQQLSLLMQNDDIIENFLVAKNQKDIINAIRQFEEM